MKQEYRQSEKKIITHKTPTLCWQCAKCGGFCDWSRREDYKPIKGWKAVYSPLRTVICGKVTKMDSYIVLECPEFVKG